MKKYAEICPEYQNLKTCILGGQSSKTTPKKPQSPMKFEAFNEPKLLHRWPKHHFKFRKLKIESTASKYAHQNDQ